MELKAYITKGIDEVGSLTALAARIGITRQALTAANAGQRGMPPVACGKLADLIGVSRWDVVAASEILTEKDEAKRAYLLPFVMETAKNVRSLSALSAKNSILSYSRSSTPTAANSASWFKWA